MPTVLLADRAFVRVAGRDAISFIDGLVTCDMARPSENYGCLLTPEGKIAFDFLWTRIFHDPKFPDVPHLWLDCPRSLASNFVRQLIEYRREENVVVEDISSAFSVGASWDARLQTKWRTYRDGRHKDLGHRFIVYGSPEQQHRLQWRADPHLYEDLRTRLGVPKGGVDFAYGEVSPFEIGNACSNGLSGKKTHYIGFEKIAQLRSEGAGTLSGTHSKVSLP
ncbi:hypothetical protein [Methylocapsa sp. S129]|uniref:hypothetical protein n=1 Tax=Methylocapsa sp. S129 TaxID=1641869 RepID=UPI00131E460E|nr:hypothetical protein [Methylocapsa sp. S129]